MQNTTQNNLQIISHKNLPSPIEPTTDTLDVWFEAYMQYSDQSGEISRKAKKQDMTLLFQYILQDKGNLKRESWTPRLSRSFFDLIKTTPVNQLLPDYKKRQAKPYSSRTINRILDHVRAFAKWIDKIKPFILGEPTQGIRRQAKALRLDVEKALSQKERNRLLDAADQLIVTGGLSQDRTRYQGKDKPQRKNYRPYRNRAIIYTLIETGMRRGGLTNIRLDQVDFKKAMITTVEKGGDQHGYSISKQGLMSIEEYIEKEREEDAEYWKNSPSLFLGAKGSNGTGGISTRLINYIWDETCKQADIEGKTPHSARHGMGRFLIEKTGNVSVVQQQLGHRNAAFSMEYARVTDEEIKGILDGR